VILEQANDRLIVEDPEEVLEWIRKRRERIKGKEARLGDLVKVDLEEEFEE